MIFLRYHLPVILYAAVIFVLSSISSLPPEIASFNLGDKLLHVIEYMIFGWLLLRSAFRWKIKLSLTRFMAVIYLIGITYAASDEIHQLFVPGREGNIADWLADIIGLAVGLITAYILTGGKNYFITGSENKSNISI